MVKGTPDFARNRPKLGWYVYAIGLLLHREEDNCCPVAVFRHCLTKVFAQTWLVCTCDEEMSIYTRTYVHKRLCAITLLEKNELTFQNEVKQVEYMILDNVKVWQTIP